MSHWKTRIFYFVTGLIFVLGMVGIVSAMPEGKAAKADKHKAVRVEFSGMELEIPADATDDLITIQDGDDNLSGIKLPYGFRAISKPYRFGPHGLKFAKGKALKARLKFDRSQLPEGFGMHSVRLFYINREKRELEAVPDQRLDASGHLTAELTHFSEYVPGVTPAWNGDGINPFMDYVHEGELSINLNSLEQTIIRNISVLKGRGIDLNLRMVRQVGKTFDDGNNPFRVRPEWRWDFPHVYDNIAYLPGGSSFNVADQCLSHGTYYECHHDYDFNGKKATAWFNGGALARIVFDDGSVLGPNGYTDRNGNTISYRFTSFYIPGSQGGYLSRMTSMIDSAGREFLFSYTDNTFLLYKIAQKLSNGTLKTILAISGDNEHGYVFKDALGRKTTYKNREIIYPNNSRITFWDDIENASVETKNATVQWYHPGESSPYRKEKYTNKYIYGTKEYYTLFDDGVRIKKYYLTSGFFRDPLSLIQKSGYSWSTITSAINIPFGYTWKEETYENNNGSMGKLMKRIDTSYFIYNAGYARPRYVTSSYVKADGSLGAASKYSYEYDSYGNVTRVIDPTGTETRMAYANTGSNANLSDFTRVDPVISWNNVSVVASGSWSFSGNASSYSLTASIQANNAPYGYTGMPTLTSTSTVDVGLEGGQVSFSVKQAQGGSEIFKFVVDGVTKVTRTTNSQRTGIPVDNYTFSLTPGTHRLDFIYQRTAMDNNGSTCYVTGLTVKSKSTYNPPPSPQYQNYRYSTNGYSSIGYDKLLTKATFIKDPVHNTTKLRQTHYKYDTKGNLIEVSEAYNNTYLVSKMTYDAYGNVTQSTDANGETLNFEYSSVYKNAYLTRVYKPTGKTIATYEYDFDLGKAKTVTDPKGNIFRYQYDAIGRLLQENLDDLNVGVTRKMAYDDINNIVTMDYGQGSEWQKGKFTFDPLFGKIAKVERMNGTNWVKIREFAFDADGRVVKDTDNLGDSVNHYYDALNREIRTVLPDGSESTVVWDDRVAMITEPNGNQRKQFFDILDRKVEVQEFPKAGETYSTKMLYDTSSQVVQVTNARGASTVYTYDELGRLMRTDFPQSGVNPLTAETYIYDNVGNLKQKTSAKGTKLFDYEFFAGYRLKQVTEPGGRVVAYSYDDNDNILNQTAPGASYTYTYDARNQVKTLQANLDGNVFGFSYDYDTFGRVKTVNYPGRVGPITYNYNDMDRLTSIPGFVSSCSYDAENKLTEMLLANGLKQTYAYDKNDRPTQIGAGEIGSLMSLNYAYDPSGNITRLNGDHYEYDGLNRLIWAGNMAKAQATAGTPWARGTAWTYDAAGNMTSKSYYANGNLLPEMGVTMTYDLSDRLLTKTQNGQTTTYTHDSAGSRLSKTDGTNAWSYSYDGENRMTRVTKNGAIIEDNAFDGGGMRVKKVNGGKTSYYVYAGPNPVLEYNATENKYTYFIFAGSTSVAEERDGKKIFYHRDHLGSTRAMTDIDKKLVGLCKYDPWGNLESTNEYDEGVINGDMEMKDSLGQLKNWVTGEDIAVGGDCTVGPTEGINGSTGLKITRTAGSTAYWSLPNLFASPDTDYELTGYYTSTGSAKAILVYRDSDGNVLASHETGDLAGASQWTAFTLASRAPINAATVEIRLTADGTAGASVRFDGLRLKVPGLEGKYDFTGKREDEDTGLVYFAARWYDPETCRFMTMDPARDGMNWWEYCEDNPMGLIDSNGKWPRDPNAYQSETKVSQTISYRSMQHSKEWGVYADNEAKEGVYQGLVFTITCGVISFFATGPLGPTLIGTADALLGRDIALEQIDLGMIGRFSEFTLSEKTYETEVYINGQFYTKGEYTVYTVTLVTEQGRVITIGISKEAYNKLKSVSQEISGWNSESSSKGSTGAGSSGSEGSKGDARSWGYEAGYGGYR